jgi:CRISPR-associated protein Cmr4
MNRKNAILGLLAQTSLHAGTGQHTGAIDLPIQREGHNGWPCVFGSAVKGALRTHAEQIKAEQIKAQGIDLAAPNAYRDHVQDAPDIAAVYGPPTNRASDHAGALIVADARLLAFPVRSLTSHFKWVTCPDALERLRRDADWLGLDLGTFDIPTVEDEADTSRCLVPEAAAAGDLFLEEYRFDAQAADLTDIITALAGLMRRDGAAEALARQLVVVGNDSFAHLVQHATPVNAHIAIDSRTKTVTGGALWYEETLPPETLLYSCLSATAARTGQAELGAERVLGLVLGLFSQRPWVQLGGNETVGMGWCAVAPVTAAREEA